MKRAITINDSIQINADQEIVWNFTQDPSLRSSWDSAVLSCELVQRSPQKVLKVTMLGGTMTNLTYKLCRKHIKTSLKLTDTKSWLFVGGGGSWSYSDSHGQTKWTQKNTLIFKNKLTYWLLARPLRFIFRKLTTHSMRKAKAIIEQKMY